MDRQHAENSRERELLAELQHRVRSTLATTRLIARRSAETSESLDDYVAHLDGRLAALTRVQNAAIRDPFAGIDLGTLVSDEITSAGVGGSTQAEMSGPKLLLHARAAEPLALAVHELMTNAIKFGALSVSDGRLMVSWQVDAGHDLPVLVLDWIETGLVLSANEPRRRGFGTIVLQDMLKYNVDADTDLDFSATGLHCRILVPLTDRVVAWTQTRPPGASA